MASISRDPNGKKRIQFTDGDKRPTIRLGKVSVKNAESFKLRIEAILSARTTGTPWDAELSAWVRDLPDAMHERLAKVELVEPRAAVAKTLGELLDRYEGSGTVKASTLAARRQTTKSLRERFGAAKTLKSITPADADAWRDSLGESGLAPATVAKRVHVAKAIFRKGVRWRLIDESPFADLRTGSQSNPKRAHYVAEQTIRACLDACPDNQWRAIIALSRYAGLRCPSEIVGLRWADVNWERGRLTVRSPKTERHEGHAVRVIPIVPELREILLACFEEAEEGAERLVLRLSDPRVNLRTTFQKIIERAGEQPWPRLFQNLRASCATDWAERFPAHAVAKWLGHSPLVSASHYLQTLDHHFEAATGGAESGALTAQIEAQRPAARGCAQRRARLETTENKVFSRSDAAMRRSAQSEKMGVTGLEPVTSAM